MIIGIDAASADVSIAILEPHGGVIADDGWPSAQRQSAELLPRLMDLLRRADLDLDSTSVVAVGTGPGSFTGLRVAMALAKGLAVGLGCPIVGIGSLPAWLDGVEAAQAALARAGAHDAYLLARDADAPVVVEEAAIRARLAGVPIVAPAELAAAFGLEHAVVPRAAAAIAERARRRLAEEPAGDDVRSLEPIYLRPPRGLDATTSETVRWL
jgi:tRNA threonylcarbamoyl adenosine modification protein YeaZ